ncbi:DNA-binding transcriptional regulator, MerR family [Streptomyces zhaozhouensis]|uniref:DNA-binding transcriptional regulator, MerR family n=1 Tax=Streptomyces zhaozhouensis TaxID=1300267 RepID=A0A286DNZ2_9ACTN|nr:MerR family transcriptional regulator [Streptomyces zhaozhouensis]SOD60350.1 DNA-binding transcriptional regulator, MerR family [Streptomyces zhaozhouensis]
MRVGELAELAGVTVRTVRYYHQVGALPTPPRRSNGYGDYTVDHLVTLLRIRQLTASGLSLAQAGAVVADSASDSDSASDPASASAEEVLDEVDRTLEARIAALTEQRRRLAQARSGRHVGLSRLAAALTVRPTDLPVATLIAHLYADAPQADLLADALLTPESRSALVSLQQRFDAIDESSPDSVLEALAEEVRRVVAALPGDLPPVPEERHRLVLTLAARDLNDRQRELVRRLD